MVGAVLLGPVGGLLGWQAGQRADAATEALAGMAGGDAVDSGLYWSASHAGEQLVEAWLGATRDEHALLDELLPGASTDQLPASATNHSAVSTVSVEPGDTATEAWRVVVVATLELEVVDPEQKQPEGEDPVTTTIPSRQFFLVPVTVDVVAETAAALTLPSVVGEPEQVDSPSTAFAHSLPMSSEIPTTVGQFLTAMLTGTGEVSRYLTPGVSIDLPQTVGYSNVGVVDVRIPTPPDELDDPAEGATTSVLTLVTLTRLDGVEISAAYTLDLTSRAGRWEITALTTPPLSGGN